MGPVHVSAGTIVDLESSSRNMPTRAASWCGFRPAIRHNGPKYAVLYMHDGQNLFDKATAGYGMEWEIDEHLPS